MICSRREQWLILLLTTLPHVLDALLNNELHVSQEGKREDKAEGMKWARWNCWRFRGWWGGERLMLGRNVRAWLPQRWRIRFQPEALEPHVSQLDRDQIPPQPPLRCHLQSLSGFLLCSLLSALFISVFTTTQSGKHEKKDCSPLCRNEIQPC